MRNLPLTLQVEESRSEAVKARPIYSNTTLFVALTAVFTALTAVVTLTIRIPFPATAGYFNLGDALVMLSGILIGPIGGFIAGGLGSALADLVGYPHFAPVTLIVKGCEGLIVGLFSHSGRARRIGVRDVAGLVLGAAAMLLGYLSAETLICGFEAALSELVSSTPSKWQLEQSLQLS